MLEIHYFFERPEESWPILKEVYYDPFGEAKLNRAREVLAAREARSRLMPLITRYVDSVN
jgi:NAD-dependent deacetylase